MNPIGHYSLSWFAVPSFTAAALVMGLGGFLVFRNRASRESVLFFVTTLTIGIWLYAFGWMYCSNDAATAIRWARLAYLGVPFIPISIYHFSVALLRIERHRQKIVVFGWLVSAFFAAMIVCTDLLIEDVYHYSWGFYPKYGWLSVPYLFFFFGMMILTMRDYWVQTRVTRPGSLAHSRARALLFAFSIAYLGSIDYLAKYGIPVYPCGYIPIFIFLVLAMRAIWKYHLIDITPAFAANQILSMMKDALLVCDSEGRVCILNDAARSLFRGKGNGAYLNELLEINNFSAKNTDENFEIQLATGTGDPMDLSVNKSVLTGKRGNPEGYVVVLRDISQQKKVERSLKFLNQLLEKRVAERTEELEKKIRELGKLNDIMMGREEKILELKDELKALQEKFGNQTSRNL